MRSTTEYQQKTLPDRFATWLTRLAWRGLLPWSLANLLLDLVRAYQIARVLRGRADLPAGQPDGESAA